MNTITPAMKDVLLQRLCENCTLEEFCDPPINRLLEGTGLKPEQARAIMAQFARLGFISEYGWNNMTVDFVLLIEAVDFWQRGGFEMQENLLLTSVDKLLLELQILDLELKQLNAEQQKKLVPGMERIAAFGANILAFYQAVNSR